MTHKNILSLSRSYTHTLMHFSMHFTEQPHLMFSLLISSPIKISKVPLFYNYGSSVLNISP